MSRTLFKIMTADGQVDSFLAPRPSKSMDPSRMASMPCVELAPPSDTSKLATKTALSEAVAPLAKAADLDAETAARKASDKALIVPLPAVTVSQVSLVAIRPTGSFIYSVDCAGARAGDILLVGFKADPPNGYRFIRAFSAAADRVTIMLECPALVVGATFAIPFSVTAIRPA